VLEADHLADKINNSDSVLIGQGICRYACYEIRSPTHIAPFDYVPWDSLHSLIRNLFHYQILDNRAFQSLLLTLLLNPFHWFRDADRRL
jgi:hypothetical protein